MDFEDCPGKVLVVLNKPPVAISVMKNTSVITLAAISIGLSGVTWWIR